MREEQEKLNFEEEKK